MKLLLLNLPCLETMMESDNFDSKEDVATALRCRDSVDDLRKEDLANVASLIDIDTNVEKKVRRAELFLQVHGKRWSL